MGSTGIYDIDLREDLSVHHAAWIHSGSRQTNPPRLQAFQCCAAGCPGRFSWLLTNRLFRGSRHGGPSTEVAERAAIRGRRGMGAECACYAQRGRPRKAAGGHGRPRKAAGRAEPEPRIAPVLCFHGNVEGTMRAGRRYSTPEAQKGIRNIKTSS